jgi:hypothetical protein
MSMGLTLGILTQYFTWRPVFSPKVDAEDSLFSAALIGSVYWITGVSAILYPGTRWIDPEFGDGSPQLIVFPVHLAVLWMGYFLESRRLAVLKRSKIRKA